MNAAYGLLLSCSVLYFPAFPSVVVDMRLLMYLSNIWFSDCSSVWSFLAVSIRLSKSITRLG